MSIGTFIHTRVSVYTYACLGVSRIYVCIYIYLYTHAKTYISYGIPVVGALERADAATGAEVFTSQKQWLEALRSVQDTKGGFAEGHRTLD